VKRAVLWDTGSSRVSSGIIGDDRVDDRVYADEDEFVRSIEELSDGRFDVLDELVLLRLRCGGRFSTL
jgi:hypothetical protein